MTWSSNSWSKPCNSYLTRGFFFALKTPRLGNSSTSFGSLFLWLIILAAENVSLISHMTLVDFCFPSFVLVSSSVSSGNRFESISSSKSSNPAKISGGLQFIFFREVMDKIFCSSWWEITLLTLKNWPPHFLLSLPPTLLSNLFLQLIKRESPAGRRNWNRKIPFSGMGTLANQAGIALLGGTFQKSGP